MPCHVFVPFRGRILLWILLFFVSLFVSAGAAQAQSGEPRSLFLVASENLEDPNFRQSVVLVTRRGPDGGPFGVIINRPTQLLLREIFKSNKRLEATNEKVYFGGPVAPGKLMFVFRADSPPEDAIEMLPGVYLSGDRELLARLLDRDQPTRNLRVFAGYSGWASHQLEMEVAIGGWSIARPEADMVFRGDTATLWPELSRRLPKGSVHYELPPPFGSAVRTALSAGEREPGVEAVQRAAFSRRCCPTDRYAPIQPSTAAKPTSSADSPGDRGRRLASMP
jgi:putative transcriptional regulator